MAETALVLVLEQTVKERRGGAGPGVLAKLWVLGHFKIQVFWVVCTSKTLCLSKY
jgi:hypothetical protein